MFRLVSQFLNRLSHCADILRSVTDFLLLFSGASRLSIISLFSCVCLALTVGFSTATAGTGGSGSTQFEITRFDVTGNSLLDAATLESVLKPFAGGRRSVLDVQQAVDALLEVYRRRGYKLVVVDLPEQVLDKGVVQLKVIEARIGRVFVSGNTEFDEANIRRTVPGLREAMAPNLDEISRALQLANESPARKITMNLSGNANGPDVDAVLNVAESRLWQVSTDLKNGGTAQTGKTRLGVTLQHANLWNRDHVASVQYGSTLEKPGNVSVYGMGYRIPLYALGDTIDLFGTYSNVNSGTVTAGLLNFTIGGKGTVLGVRYNQTLKKGDNWESRLIYGIDQKSFKNDFLLASENLGSTVMAMPVSLSFAAQGRLAEGEVTSLVGVSLNVPGGRNGADGDFAKVRVGAKSNYGAVRLSGSYLRASANDWRVRAVMNGQFSADALVPGEQIGAGGAASVRGLAERALAGDSGIVANLEFYSPNFCLFEADWQCRALVFHDAAYVRRNEALPGEFVGTTVRSLGLGLRLSMGRAVSIDLDYGHVALAGAATSQARNRLHLRAVFVY